MSRTDIEIAHINALLDLLTQTRALVIENDTTEYEHELSGDDLDLLMEGLEELK